MNSHDTVKMRLHQLKTGEKPGMIWHGYGKPTLQGVIEKSKSIRIIAEIGFGLFYGGMR